MSRGNILYVNRKNDRDIPLTFTDTSIPAPVDITGYTIYFTVKEDIDADLDDSEALINKEITSHDDPENGITTVSLTHDDTNLSPGNYVYDIKWLDSNNKELTIVVGDFIIQESVTLLP